MRRCGVEVVLMPEVGHFPMLEKPEDFNACLLRAIGYQMISSGGKMAL
jgi:pimeloyl-ACP methyl ester carboxylesterase